MPTRSTSKSSSSSTSRRTSSARRESNPQAFKLLMADHKEVKKCFKEFDKLMKDEADTSEKQQLAQRICMLLKIHTTLEEEIFYPAAREAMEEMDLLNEAQVEHDAAKDLIEQIESMSPDEDLYDAKVCVLGEYVQHHIGEEEDELFPKLKKAKEIDLDDIGEQLQARKEELMQEMGGEALH